MEPENFWAQLKYAELHYRLRVLDKAEEETRRAAELATSPLQLALARKQAQDIRTLKHSCVRNVHWTKPLTVPVLVLAGMFATIFVVMPRVVTSSVANQDDVLRPLGGSALIVVRPPISDH